MTVLNMPEGVEAGLKIYLTGKIKGTETEVVISADGMPSFSDSVSRPVDVESLVNAYELKRLGHSWRVMTRAEIDEYKRRNESGVEIELHDWPELH